MLEELDIKNFALIDSAHVEFGGGFTVLSGETGAGKSILIGSLAFLLGGKAGVEQIRTGCTEAQVSGTFLLDGGKEAAEWLDEHGIESDENRILIRRMIRDSGSIRVSERSATRKRVGSSLLPAPMALIIGVPVSRARRISAIFAVTVSTASTT